jgi:hypothetical protein
VFEVAEHRVALLAERRAARDLTGRDRLRAIAISRPTRTAIDHHHTTNLAFKQWGNTFPGAACVVAFVDRFAQHCHRVEIAGESYRDDHRLETDRPRPSTSKSRRKRT